MRILIVEDDETLCEAVKSRLSKEGFTIDLCFDGGDAMYYITKQSYDVIILDRLLPNKDGISILCDMRAKNIFTPVILVTALGSISDKVNGLDAGADDYLPKPFAPEELIARIRALARRPRALSPIGEVNFLNMTLNVDKKTLTTNFGSCTLSGRETSLLELFMKNHNQIVTRELILSRVWGPNSFVENGNIDNYVHFVRKRLKTVKSQAYIKTIHSVGYILEEN